MTSHDNEKLYRRLINEVFNQAAQVHHGRYEHRPQDEGVKRVATTLRNAFPDFKLTIEDLAVDGDRVWARQRGGGTNGGSFFGHPPTGKTGFIEVFDVVRFADGKMVEHWGVPDQLSMLIQLGLVSAPERQAPAKV